MAGSGRADDGPSFEALAYQVLIIDRISSVAAAAAALDLSASSLYSRLHGRSRFRAHEIRLLIDHVEDPRLLRFFADDSRFVIAERPRADKAGTVASATFEALHEAIDLMKVVLVALEDGPRLDHRDRAVILREVKDAETAIANLRAAIELG